MTSLDWDEVKSLAMLFLLSLPGFVTFIRAARYPDIARARGEAPSVVVFAAKIGFAVILFLFAYLAYVFLTFSIAMSDF